MAVGLQRLRQRRLPRQPAADRQDHRHARARCCNEARAPPLDESTRTIDARNAFVMTSLLQEVTRSGTAARAQAHAEAPRHLRQDRHHQRLAWTPGSPASSRASSAVVWIGYDTPRKLGDRETGGGLALPVWIDYMAHELKGVPVQEPAAPEASSTSAASGTSRSSRAAPASAAWASRTSRRRRRRARKSATASSICSGAERSAGATAQAARSAAPARPARWRSADSDVEELAAVARVEPAPVDRAEVEAAGRAPPATAPATAAGC